MRKFVEQLITEKYQLHMISKDGESFKTGVYKNKKEMLDAHYKATKSKQWKKIHVLKSKGQPK